MVWLSIPAFQRNQDTRFLNKKSSGESGLTQAMAGLGSFETSELLNVI